MLSIFFFFILILQPLWPTLAKHMQRYGVFGYLAEMPVHLAMVSITITPFAPRTLKRLAVLIL